MRWWWKMVKYIFNSNNYEGSNITPNDNNVYFYYATRNSNNAIHITKNFMGDWDLSSRKFFNSVPHVNGIAYYESNEYTTYNTWISKSLSTLNNNLVRNVPILPYTLLVYLTSYAYSNNDNENHEWMRALLRVPQGYKDISTSSFASTRINYHFMALRDYDNTKAIDNIELFTLNQMVYGIVIKLHCLYSPFVIYPNYTIVVPKGSRITLQGYLGSYFSYLVMNLNDQRLSFNQWSSSTSTSIFNGRGWIKGGYGSNVAKFEVKLNAQDIFTIERGWGLIHKAIIDVPS